MESLALAAAVAMLLIVGVSLAALAAGIWRRYYLGWVTGPLSVLAGLWLAVTLPHLWPLAAWFVGVGVWTAWRVK
jgi:hypothetical protein